MAIAHKYEPLKANLKTLHTFCVGIFLTKINININDFYGKISFENQSFSVPKLKNTKVIILYLPDKENPEIRIIHQGKVIKIVKLKKSS